jgi:hypothetical protein
VTSGNAEAARVESQKYRPLVPALRELVLRPDTPLGQDVKDMITRQLDNAERRLATRAG